MKKRKHIVTAVVILLTAVCLAAGCFILGDNHEAYYNADGSYNHVDANDSFGYIEMHPAYAEFSSFIQPWKDPLNQWGTPLLSMNMVCAVNGFHVESVIEGLNCVIDAAETGQIYYDFYTEAERTEDPEKEETGLIFIPGEKDAPVAFVVAGGGFTCVCLFSEGFQTANELHKLGYNVFLLKYRVNTEEKDFEKVAAEQERYANEDFGKALQYLFENQETLGVCMDGYSVWGFSAGGRTSFLWGLDNAFGYENYVVPAPGAMIFGYSGWYDAQFAGQYGTMPPAYFAWLPNDNVIGEERAKGIGEMIAYMRENGLTVEDQPFYEARHGFGDGRGTDAEGWIGKACAFWEEQIT